MCVDPVTKIVVGAVGAAANEYGKTAAEGLSHGVAKTASRIKNMPVDKAIANGSAFDDYLQNACATISRTKTMLYRQPTSIESFFEPTNIEVNKNRLRRGSGISVSTKRAEDVLKLGSRLIIAGHAGAGKSILMRHLFIDAYRSGLLIPIYVELRAINQARKGTTIIDLIYQSLHEHGVAFGQDDLVRNLDNQDFLVLLDGLDEVAGSRMGALRDGIESLGNEHPRLKIVLSSRVSEDEFRSWEGYVVARTSRLSKGQAVSLVSRLEFDDADAKERFARELDAHLYERHRSFASNPLLLTMMLMVFSERATIPDDFTEFYSQTFDALFRRHDANKRGKYHRELKCGLDDEDFRRVFSNFCFITFLKDELSFTRAVLMGRIGSAIKRMLGDESEIDGEAFFHDLLESVCMLQLDGCRYTFVHRSFQEYFAAVYTMRLDSDDKLRGVVVDWLDRHGFFIEVDSSRYLDALMRLNPNRFERQVLFESLRELRDACFKSENPQYSFLSVIYGN